MADQVYLNALAGLLHDIGKFAQRAGVTANEIWDDEARKDFKYQHALLSANVVDQIVPQTWRITVKNAVSGHHRADRKEQLVLMLADHLSAGERADPTEDDPASFPNQLLSIFCSIDLDGQRAPQGSYWPLEELDFDLNTRVEKISPGRPWEESAISKAYQATWERFITKAKQLKEAHENGKNFPGYLESLLYLLQRYTWCIPSAYYRNRPDISLYDHSRMTAALSQIIADRNFTDDQLKDLIGGAQDSQKEIALLVGGDISGVQDFLYTITHRGATSALRGRSFYLQLFNELVARYFLRRLDLPVTNLIYAGGGNFYLLARISDSEKLSEIQKEITQILLTHHPGSLYLAIESIPLNSMDFFKGRLSNRWEELSERTQRAKLRRYVDLSDDDLIRLFKPQGHGGNRDRQCRVCGIEHPDTRHDKDAVTPDDPEGVRKCPACRSYEELGEDLRKAEYLILDAIQAQAQPIGDVPGDWNQVFQALGFKVFLSDQPPRDKPAGESRVIFALKKSALEKLEPNSQTSIGRRFYVNVTPILTRDEIKNLDNKPFENLPVAESTKPFHVMEEQSMGIKRLGVLRMDLDNLGKIFSRGLGEHASLSRIASLSLAISIFFEGWVEVLAERRNAQNKGNLQRGDLLYSIYSGGDDLFFVGAWDEVVELAREIRADLGSFAGNHPAIHASAGVVLVGGKYPLAQAAEDAKRAEEQAKALIWWDNQGRAREKDAISFLGQPLPWTRFGLNDCSQTGFDNAHALMHLLYDLVQSKRVQRSLLMRLGLLYDQYREAEIRLLQKSSFSGQRSRPKTLWGPWHWRTFYTLTRLSKTKEDNGKNEWKEKLLELRDQLKKDEFRSMDYVGFAARWAELITR